MDPGFNMVWAPTAGLGFNCLGRWLPHPPDRHVRIMTRNVSIGCVLVFLRFFLEYLFNYNPPPFFFFQRNQKNINKTHILLLYNIYPKSLQDWRSFRQTTKTPPPPVHCNSRCLESDTLDCKAAASMMVMGHWWWMRTSATNYMKVSFGNDLV